MAAGAGAGAVLVLAMVIIMVMAITMVIIMGMGMGMGMGMVAGCCILANVSRLGLTPSRYVMSIRRSLRPLPLVWSLCGTTRSSSWRCRKYTPR